MLSTGWTQEREEAQYTGVVWLPGVPGRCVEVLPPPTIPGDTHINPHSSFPHTGAGGLSVPHCPSHTREQEGSLCHIPPTHTGSGGLSVPHSPSTMGAGGLSVPHSSLSTMGAGEALCATFFPQPWEQGRLFAPHCPSTMGAGGLFAQRFSLIFGRKETSLRISSPSYLA